MAPKKKEQQQKMSLGDFLTDSGFGGGSWADEVEETYVTGTQPLPPSDRPRFGGGSSGMSNWQDRGYSSIRENLPQKLPDKPPFTAHLGNLAYDATNESVTEFFEGCEVVSVRIIEDREMQRPKGFGYVEFADIEGLKKALTLDGESFNGRMIKIKIADPPRGGDSRGGESSRDLSDWTRKGPLPDLPGRGGRAGSDFGGDRERRPPRDPAAEPRAPREMNWERRGPLSPLTPQEGGPGPREGSRSRPAPEGMGERGESHRGSRQGSASWGEGRQDGSRPPRREQPERAPTAAEKDFQWRSSMRPDAAKAPEETETAVSPSAPAPAAQGGRPRLNLQKRTVTETTEAAPTGSSGDSKASPFGAARPINTAAREQEIEEKRQIAIREKREADEKAKEERRLAKQAAAEKEEADAAAAAAAAAAAQAEEAKEPEVKSAEDEAGEKENGASTEEKGAPRSREPREPKEPIKSRATESGNWRSASNDQRVPRGPPGGGRGRGGAARGHRNEGRGGPRANGARDQQASAAQGAGEGETTPVDEDGWTTVPNKKGRQGRPLA
ncbi:RNA recognition motif domain protein [Metarhizium robertsii ARSEF 23]|uniref:RNA recognition motif domain protein n=1 Tax=Metarhizium robertsii (strain ARSEF 23 / ATCC MYA-3075) TaxID=655844 RepID=E9F9E8_METRA|nr:RNA recognition motif domain protein [Metarhizium robertsii ARSEF 23]EFY95601.1 RNA recognition motif domain protein [Metarhizium robertsii ARSEF 23]